jgi:hypothetical protein
MAAGYIRGMKKVFSILIAIVFISCDKEEVEPTTGVNFSLLTKYDWIMVDPDSTYADHDFVYADTTIYSFYSDMTVKTIRTQSLVLIHFGGEGGPRYELQQDKRLHEGTYVADEKNQTIRIDYHRTTSLSDGEELENILIVEPLGIIELNAKRFVANFANLYTIECKPLPR